MTRELPVLKPDPDRAARVMTRCRERLERRAETPARPVALLIERVIVGGLALIYLSAMIGVVASIPPPG